MAQGIGDKPKGVGRVKQKQRQTMITRELLMNAIMHRDYESNAPVAFYEYDDRIEIQNAGGLYGKVSANNFPNVSDYRNPFIAEAMEVLVM